MISPNPDGFSGQTEAEAQRRNNGYATNGAAPLYPMFTPPPGGMPFGAPGAAQSPAISPWALLAAFRRRWLLALTLGLFAGGTAAAMAWWLIPAPYTAFGEIHVKSRPPKFLFDVNEPSADFGTYRTGLMRQITGPFVLAAALRDPDVAHLPVAQSMDHPVEWLEKTISVSTPASEFIRISLSGEDPGGITAIVNAVQDAFMQEVAAKEIARRRLRLENLQTVQSDLDNQLSSKTLAISKLAKALNTGDAETLTVKQQMAVEYFAQVRSEHARVRFELMRLQSELAAASAQKGDVAEFEIPDEVLEAEVDKAPSIQSLRERESQLQTLIVRTRQRVTRDDHPVLVGYRNELKTLQNSMELERRRLKPEIAEAIRTRIESEAAAGVAGVQQRITLLTTQEEQLRTELENQRIEAKEIGIGSFELETLRQESGKISDVRDRIASEIQQLNVELDDAVAEPRITKYRTAEVPHARDFGRKYKLTGLAGFGMFSLLVGGIVWLEFNSRRISCLDEVVGGLSLRIIGCLPVMPRWMSKGRSSRSGHRNNVLRSVWTESIDATRTVVLRNAQLEPRRILMIGSAVGGEGKTTLSCHLGTSLARAGRNTLLIDADLRRPSLSKVFDVPVGPGLCEVLRGEAALADVIRPTSLDGLSLIPAGRVNQKVLQLLAQDGVGPLFDQLREEFEFVILDTAPILPVTDSLLIGQHVDAALFSIRRDVSRYGKVAAACQRLQTLGVPILGAVVTGLDESSYGYSGQYRYGPYGAYGYYAQPTTV